MLDMWDDWPIPYCLPYNEQLVNDVPTQEQLARCVSAATFWSSDCHITPHTTTHSYTTEPEQYQSHELNAVFSQFLPSVTNVMVNTKSSWIPKHFPHQNQVCVFCFPSQTLASPP
jgi:hypothetical protein